MGKGLTRALLLAKVLLVVTACAPYIAPFAARSSRDWQFVQSVGGIAVNQPTRDNRGHVLLPIRCDVSGRQAVTVQPTAIHSALVCEPPLLRVHANKVSLTIRTTVASNRNSDARCPVTDLGPLAAGKYSVVYRCPNGDEQPIGAIRVR